MTITQLWIAVQLYKLMEKGHIEPFDLPYNEEDCRLKLLALAARGQMPEKSFGSIAKFLEEIYCPLDHWSTTVKVIDSDLQERANLEYVALAIQRFWVDGLLSEIPPTVATLATKQVSDDLAAIGANGIHPQTELFESVVKYLLPDASTGKVRRILNLIERYCDVQ